MSTIADFEVTGEASLDPDRLIGDIDAVLAKLDEFEAKLDEISHKMDELSNKGIHVELAIDGQDKLDELILFLDDISSHDYTVRIKIEIIDQDKLDKLYIELLELELYDHTIKAKVEVDNLDATTSKLDSFGKAVDDTGKKLDKAKGSSDGFKFSMMMLAPLLVPISAGLLSIVGGLGGLAAAAGAMVVPGAAFLFSMKSMYTQASTLVTGLNAATQAALGNATTFGQVTSILDKNSKAYQNMDSYMRNVVTEYVLLKNALTQFQNAIKPEVAVALGNIFTIIKVALTDLIPAVQQFGLAFNGVLGTFLSRLQDPTFKKFFADATTWMGALVTAWGDGFINIIEGITALLDAFLPLGVKMSSGFLKMTESFDTWAQHLADSKGFKTFIGIVETDGPLILKILGQIGLLIWNVAMALGSSKINGSFLSGLLSILETVNKLLGSHQGLSQVAGDLLLVGLAAWKLGPALGPLLSFLTTPVGLVVGGILLLAGGFLLLYKNSKTFHDWVNTNLLPMFKQFGTSLGQLKDEFIKIWPDIQKFWNMYGQQIVGLLLTDLKLLLGVATGLLQMLLGVFELFIGVLTGHWSLAWKGITDIFGGFWKIIVTLAKTMFNQILLDASMFGTFLKASWNSLWNNIIVNLISFGVRIVGSAINAFNNLNMAAVNGMFRFLTSILNGILGVVNWFTRLPGNILNALGNLGSLLFNAGVNLIIGFINGIISMFGSVASTLGSLTNMLTSWKGPPERDKMILHSSGQMVINGFIDGMESRYAAVANSLGGLTNSIGGKFGSQFSADISGKLNASLSSQLGSTSVGTGGSLSGGVAQNVTFGNVTINNPSQESGSQSLTKMLQSTAAFGIVQAPIAAAFPGSR